MTTDTTVRDVRCYVLVRNDLPSLNAGKATAHTHHAGVQMVAKYLDNPMVQEYIRSGVAGGADHFNTTISLSASLSQIETTVSVARTLGYVTDVVEDPSYPFFVDSEVAPLLDGAKVSTTAVVSKGQTLVTRKETTCGYLLGYADDVIFRALVGALGLMP